MLRWGPCCEPVSEGLRARGRENKETPLCSLPGHSDPREEASSFVLAAELL